MQAGAGAGAGASSEVCNKDDQVCVLRVGTRLVHGRRLDVMFGMHFIGARPFIAVADSCLRL